MDAAVARPKQEEEEEEEEGHREQLAIEVERWVLDSSVDHKGKVPLRSKTGVWKAALFILGIEVGERLSYFGLSTNLIIYLTKVLRQEVKTAAKSVNYWTGVTTMAPLLGGFLADSYLGRFHTVLLSSLLYILGLVLLTLSQYIPHLKPLEGSLRRHEAIFFAATYVIAVSTGGHKPALESFGADQFDGDDDGERRKKMSYFNWWNAGLCIGLILGVTFIVYLQDAVGWGVSYVVLTVVMAVGLVVFCLGRPFYRYRIPAGSPFIPLLQVLTAATAKRGLSCPSDPSELHEKIGRGGADRQLDHTASLRFLDKAAIIEHRDDGAAMAAELQNPWRLATVTQVEETKMILHMIPIWLTTQTFGLCLAQASTFFIKQGSVMDRRLGASFEVPPASVYSLAAVSMIVSVAIYDRLLVPFLRRATGNERGISILHRIGYGMAFSTLAMATAAIVEKRRRDAGHRSEMLSVFWLAPQFTILGIADGFALVGLQEYFYEQVPEGMRSIGIAFYLSVIGVSNFLSSLLITVVDRATGGVGRRSWFGSDLDGSRLDLYYWLLAAINSVNLCAYAVVAGRCSGRCARVHRRVAIEDGDDLWLRFK